MQCCCRIQWTALKDVSNIKLRNRYAFIFMIFYPVGSGSVRNKLEKFLGPGAHLPQEGGLDPPNLRACDSEKQGSYHNFLKLVTHSSGCKLAMKRRQKNLKIPSGIYDTSVSSRLFNPFNHAFRKFAENSGQRHSWYEVLAIFDKFEFSRVVFGQLLLSMVISKNMENTTRYVL